MTSVALVTVLSSFLAAAVEFVEAVTIVLAVGVTRQWRSALFGTLAAVCVLALLVGVFGTAIALLVPIEMLRLVVGGFLLIYGLQWLTRAVLRAGGAAAKHDEGAIYERQVAALREEPPVPAAGMDWISFTVAFKGVLLEGLEVSFIVVTFGATSNLLGPAVLGAGAAGFVVLVVAALVHRPLAQVPENGLKFAVGVMLTTFGTFWAGEGLGIAWPASDAAILALLAGYVVVALVGTAVVRERVSEPRGRSAPASMGSR